MFFGLLASIVNASKNTKYMSLKILPMHDSTCSY